MAACAILIVSHGASGCGGGKCVDQDLDGFGLRCAAPDCDDTNPLRNVDCDSVPPPDCELDPTQPGCPCVAFVSATCFPGAPSELDVGECRAGRALCINGTYGLCAGAAAPVDEVCDGLDQDCDGRVDEGVRSPCGGCDARCFGGVWGEPNDPFLANEGDGVAVTEEGALTLRREFQRLDNLWVPNTEEGTITRIDLETHEAVALYESGGRGPTRLAVDWRGDAFVLNREFGATSTLRKITSDLDRCEDRNDSGSVETSTDPTVALPDDECVLFTVPVGEVNEVARAIAVDGTLRSVEGQISGGDVWVGLHGGQAVLWLDGETGAERARVETPGFRPYGATVDAFGTVSMIAQEGQLLRFPRTQFGDPAARSLIEVPLSCYLLYGIAADPRGRLVLTGFSCDQLTVHDPLVGTFRTVDTPPSVRSVTILPAAVADGEGEGAPRAWVAHTEGLASEIDLDRLRVRQTVELGGSIETIGAARDGQGRAYFISAQSVPGDPQGLAVRVDPELARADRTIQLGELPHAQGDLSGGRLYGPFVSEGTARRVFLGCDDGTTTWRALHTAHLPGADSEVIIEARHAATVEELDAAAFVPLVTLSEREESTPLDFPFGGVLEIRVVLRAGGRDGAPRLQRVGVEWGCSMLG